MKRLTRILRLPQAPINFYFEYAYDAPRWGKENLHEYLVLWAAREWGADHAEKIADVFERYMHVSVSLPSI